MTHGDRADDDDPSGYFGGRGSRSESNNGNGNIFW